MAYVVWRVLMKKYSKVRLGLQKGSTCPHSTSNNVSPMWVSSSNFYATDVIDNSSKTIESQSSDATGNESTYKNLSKVRTYLKRCENAINSINLSGKRSTTSSAETDINHEKTKQPTSSWYIEEFGTEPNGNFSDLNFVENELSSIKVMEKSMPKDETTNSIYEYDNNHIKKIEHIKPEFYMVISYLLRKTKRNMRESKK